MARSTANAAALTTTSLRRWRRRAAPRCPSPAGEPEAVEDHDQLGQFVGEDGHGQREDAGDGAGDEDDEDAHAEGEVLTHDVTGAPADADRFGQLVEVVDHVDGAVDPGLRPRPDERDEFLNRRRVDVRLPGVGDDGPGQRVLGALLHGGGDAEQVVVPALSRASTRSLASSSR